MQERQTCQAGTPLLLYHPSGRRWITLLSQWRERQGHTVCCVITQECVLCVLHILSGNTGVAANQEGARGSCAGLQQSHDSLEACALDTCLRGKIHGIHPKPDAAEARGV